MSLESLVRPFQTGDIAPPRSVITDAPQAVANVRLEIGKSGRGKTFGLSGSVSFSCYMPAQHREDQNPPDGSGKSRQETPKRVRNPNDRSQFVDVNVADSVWVTTGSGPAFQQIRVKYDNSHAQGDDVPDEGEPPLGGTVD